MNTWTFEDTITSADFLSIRLDAVKLAVQVHDLGMAKDGDTVLETAQRVVDFING